MGEEEKAEEKIHQQMNRKGEKESQRENTFMQIGDAAATNDSFIDSFREAHQPTMHRTGVGQIRSCRRNTVDWVIKVMSSAQSWLKI